MSKEKTAKGKATAALLSPASHLENQVRFWLENEGYRIVPVRLGSGEPADWAFGVIFRPNPKSDDQAGVPFAIIGREYNGKIELIHDLRLPPAVSFPIPSATKAPSRVYLRVREVCLQHEVGFAIRSDGNSTVIRVDDILYEDAPITRHLLLRSLRRMYSIMLHLHQAVTEAADGPSTRERKRR